ncbi:phage tail assembly chaperone [Sphingobium aromaticiconvertens]|uniref:phage tail assembly chaperone n=1 Tax=Sphingobium aromaticiconvertens TaxID=365341 RepID=UPI003016DF83
MSFSADDFSGRAARLAGVAAWLLGWRPDEFWRATPDELAAVMAAARGEAGGVEGVDGAELARLRAAFPDG